jgi:hypothetical protein
LRRNPPNKIALSKSYKVDLIWWITTQKARLIHPTLLKSSSEEDPEGKKEVAAMRLRDLF